MSVLPARKPGPHDDTVDHGAERAYTERAYADPGHRHHADSYDTATLPVRAPVDLDEPAAPPRRRRGGRGPRGIEPRPGHIPGLDGLRAIAITSEKRSAPSIMYVACSLMC